METEAIEISVIMSAYREAPACFKLAAESILNQSYSGFEFIIVLDDPENTELKEIILAYAQKDARIRVLHNEKNLGLAMSLNRGIEAAKGTYIARMDADDIALPNRLEKQLQYMKHNPTVDILGTNKIVIDETGNEIGKGGILPKNHKKIEKCMQYTCIMIHPSIMMKRESIVRIGCYRPFPAAQDQDLWLRAMSSGLILNILDEYLLYYRVNSQSISKSKAYLQAICSEYIRALYKERKKRGADSFSTDAFFAYLNKKHVDDPAKAEKYRAASERLTAGVQAVKRKRILSGCRNILFACLSHSLVLKQTYRRCMCAFMKRR